VPVELQDDGYCFVCGKLNAEGLQLSFQKTEQGITARFSIPRRFQGYQNIVHGGIIAALLDEASVKLLALEGARAVTAEMNLRYRKPLRVEENAEVRAFLKERQKRICLVDAMIKNQSGDTVASGTVKLFMLGN